jgi:hypothetical protein
MCTVWCVLVGITFTLVIEFFVCKVARETNEELYGIKADPGFFVFIVNLYGLCGIELI